MERAQAVLDDNQIVELFLARDESALSAVSEKYGADLKRIAANILDDEGAAEECENDTYLEAWNLIPPNEPKEYLYPFLARIIRHLALNCCRDRSRLKRSAFICELSAEMEQCIPAFLHNESMADDIAFKEILNGFLSALDTEKRTIFLRRYWFMESVAEISDRLGISESKIKTTLFRCRKKFRQCLEKEGYIL